MEKNQVTISTKKLMSAIASLNGEAEAFEFDTNAKAVVLDIDTVPPLILQATFSYLSKKGQKIVAEKIGPQPIAGKSAKNVSEFIKLVRAAAAGEKLTFEFKLGDRWIPSKLEAEIFPTMLGAAGCASMNYAIGDCSLGPRVYVWPGDFVDEDGDEQTIDIEEFLEKNGIRQTTPERVAEHEKDVRRAEKMESAHGTVVDSIAPVLVRTKFWYSESLEARALGTPDVPSQMVVDPVLEREHSPWQRELENVRIPYVRCFSLIRKEYVFAHVRDVKEHEYDTGALERLVLPEHTKKTLTAVFEGAKDGKSFGDLFRGRHGGTVVLASGPPGTGKTLSAETYAEYVSRPLYVMEMGELGTNLESVEVGLQRVFARAERWNAVLLFDEADIFLAKRTDSDLERSAIVGVFLRLLDHYRGVFFLTTNRRESLDQAVKSRVTLALDYSALDANARERVWTRMLDAAGIQADGSLTALRGIELDGRQIRNCVRLAALIHGRGRVSTSDLISVTNNIAR